jgi:hypothetical protein
MLDRIVKNWRARLNHAYALHGRLSRHTHGDGEEFLVPEGYFL